MSTEAVPQTFNDFNGNIVVVINPAATSVAKASASRRDRNYMDRELGSLVRAYHNRIKYVETEAKTELTHERLYEALFADDIESDDADTSDAPIEDMVVNWGGDGHDNDIGNFFRSNPLLKPRQRRVPMLSIMAGNANNGSRELTPIIGHRRPKILDILQGNNQVIDTYGTRYTVKRGEDPQPEDDEVIDALFDCSIQIGVFVGLALSKVKSNKLRSIGGRSLVDSVAVLRGVMDASSVEMTINGEAVSGLGSICCSSKPFLKHLKTPASVAEKAFYELTLDNDGLLYIGGLLTRYATGRLPWRQVNEGESLEYKINAARDQEIYVERDAEVHLIKSKEDPTTHFTVIATPHEVPLRMITDNPDLMQPPLAA